MESINDKIVQIDEVAAAADITKINDAKEKLQTAMNSLNRMKAEAELMNCMTSDAITDKSNELLVQLAQLQQNLDRTINEIRSAVRDYQERDAQNKVIIDKA